MICCDRFFIFLSLANLAQNQPFQKTALFFASLVKGEVLSPERIRANAGGIAFLPHPFRFSDTSANNHSIVGSASHCNRSSPLHKGAKSDTALPTIFQNLTTPIQNHRHRQSTDACNGRTKSLCTDAYSQQYQVTARCSEKKWLTMHGRSDHKRP